MEQADERDLDEGTASDLAGRLEIRDNPVSRSYDAVLDGTVAAMIVYEDDGTRRAFDHTVVDPEHRGRGIATMLVKAALDDLRATELTSPTAAGSWRTSSSATPITPISSTRAARDVYAGVDRRVAGSLDGRAHSRQGEKTQ